jgi:hypothetical protein
VPNPVMFSGSSTLQTIGSAVPTTPVPGTTTPHVSASW